MDKFALDSGIFFLIDMDPSDGVPTTYLVPPGAPTQLMQATQNNRNANPTAKEIANDGDNRLMAFFVHPATGCKTWTLPDLADPGVLHPSNIADLLQSMTYTPMPWAMLPNMDPMTTTNGAPDLAKLNMFRSSVNEPLIGRIEEADTAHYCANYAAIGVPRFTSLKAALMGAASPMPGVSLFTFMINRATATWGPNGLNCVGLTGVQNPFALI